MSFSQKRGRFVSKFSFHNVGDSLDDLLFHHLMIFAESCTGLEEIRVVFASTKIYSSLLYMSVTATILPETENKSKVPYLT